VAILLGWRLGANAVLSFWLAYILTRPLGANLGDLLASPTSQQGLGVGTAATSVIFLAAILATVVYLTVTRSDVIEDHEKAHTPRVITRPARERAMLGYFAVVAVATGVLLGWGAAQPHADPTSEDNPAPAPTAQLAPGQATAHFPPDDVSRLRTITQDTLAKLRAGDQAGATSRIKDLETAWDDGQPTLQPLDDTAWHVLDGQIDTVLTALRASSPDPAAEQTALATLLTSLH
jgi:hypothetical protein